MSRPERLRADGRRLARAAPTAGTSGCARPWVAARSLAIPAARRGGAMTRFSAIPRAALGAMLLVPLLGVQPAVVVHAASGDGTRSRTRSRPRPARPARKSTKSGPPAPFGSQAGAPR